MAARFKFRLEAVLKLRRSLEEEAQRHLARMIALQEAAQERLIEFQGAHLETVEGRRMVPNQVVDLERLRATERYLMVLEQRIRWAAQELKEAQEQVAASRLALVKAHQDHLMLQRLKERRLLQHQQELQLIEIKEMDEMAVLRHRLSHTAPEVKP